MLTIQAASSTSTFPALAAEGSPCPSWAALCRARGLWNILQLESISACTGAAWEQFPAALWFVLETCKRDFGGWLRHSFFPPGFPAVPAPQPSRSSGCLGCKFSKISWRKFFRMSFKKNQSETWMFSQSCADFGKGVVHFRRKTNRLWCYSDSVNEKSKE